VQFADLPSSQQFRQSRSARNRSRAASTEKSRFSNLPIVHTNGDFQDISAYRVADTHGCRRILQLPGIARILKMIQHFLCKHVSSMNVRLYLGQGRSFGEVSLWKLWFLALDRRNVTCACSDFFPRRDPQPAFFNELGETQRQLVNSLGLPFFD
jgi:hypothetical protein